MSALKEHEGDTRDHSIFDNYSTYRVIDRDNYQPMKLQLTMNNECKINFNSIPNLLNGVSQQPDTVKLPNQATIQENGLSDIISGLGKRPPTEHIAKLNTDTLTNSKVHIINRDSNEQYAVLVNNQSIKVYDLAGNNKTVVSPNGLTYLTSTNPQEDFNLVTVADYTFIVNKTKTVTKSGTTATARPDEALFYVKNGQYKTTYKIFIDGVEQASYTTLDNSSSGNASSITTDNIATELYNDLNSNLSGYTVNRDGSIIYVAKLLVHLLLKYLMVLVVMD